MDDGSSELVFYNGFTANEMDGRYGFAHLGVENVKPIITRGILIDVPAYKGISRLSEGYEVTVSDVLGALEKQGMTDADLEVGDAILIRHGWAQLWDQPDIYYSTMPSIGQAVAAWAADRKPSMVGSDTGGPFGAAHQELLAFNGIYIVENMDLRQLAADGVYEFMLIVTPLPLVGASGSPVRPVAIR